MDEVIPEPLGGAHLNHQEAAENLKAALLRHLEEVSAWSVEERLRRRYQKYRAFGHFRERGEAAEVKETSKTGPETLQKEQKEEDASSTSSAA